MANAANISGNAEHIDAVFQEKEISGDAKGKLPKCDHFFLCHRKPVS